nr:hypothetical protein [uncultured Butyricicoccus sp.]
MEGRGAQVTYFDYLRYVPYVLLFALVTALLYAWGLWRSQNQGRDLNAMLSAKGISRIRGALKKNGPMTRKELEQVVQGLSARQPFSRNGIQVNDAKKFLDSLLPYMLKQKLIEEQQQEKKVVYVYRK